MRHRFKMGDGIRVTDPEHPQFRRVCKVQAYKPDPNDSDKSVEVMDVMTEDGRASFNLREDQAEPARLSTDPPVPAPKPNPKPKKGARASEESETTTPEAKQTTDGDEHDPHEVETTHPRHGRRHR